MAIIIGFGTTVTGFTGVASAQWGINQNAQRLYTLGTATPFKVVYKPTETLSITCYEGGDTLHLLPVSVACLTSCTTITAAVSPAACVADSGIKGVSGDWFVSGYSFFKNDPQLPGQASWSMTRWVDGPTGTDSPAPTVVIRGVSEGTSTGSGTGVNFIAGTTSEGSSGSISAGQTGQADTSTAGEVASVGDAAPAAGAVVSGNASINLIPLWL